MAELKTKPNDADVGAFINAFADTEQKKKDSFEIIRLMQDVSGHEPKMWGDSMIGFGSYHYKSERSSQEGNWPLVGFSPRKTAISLYVYSGCSGQADLLNDLGKFKMGKACIYIKKLSDINQDALKLLIRSTIDFLQSKYGGPKNLVPMNQKVTHYINNAPEEQKQIMMQIRDLIHRSVKNVTEEFKWSRPVFRQQEDFAYLQANKNHVNLGFINFQTINDFDGILQGTGKNMRHIKLSDTSDINNDLLAGWFIALTQG